MKNINTINSMQTFYKVCHSYNQNVLVDLDHLKGNNLSR